MDFEEKEYPWHKIYEARGLPQTLEPYPREPSHFFLDRAAGFETDGGCVQLGLDLPYRDLKDQADRLANALAQRGVSKGDRVATMLPASIQFVICDAGISKAGAVHIPCNPLDPAPSLVKKFKETSPKILICLAGDMDKAGSLLQETELTHVMATCLEDYSSNPPSPVHIPGAEHFTKVIEQASPVPPSVIFETYRDLESLFFTGGTTGTAKCCMLSHYNLVANVHQNLGGYGLAGREISVALPVLAALPTYHVYGHATMHAMISLGAKVIIANDPANTDEMRKLVEKYSPLLFFGVPTQYIKLLEAKVSGFSPLGISGSAPLNPNVQEKIEETAGMRISEGYGLSEMTMSTHHNVSIMLRKTGSIGIPLPDTIVKILDVESGETIPVQEMIKDNKTGVMLLKGPQRMVGYWPEAGSGIDSDGFINTGDVVRVDEDGYFYVVDRTKDMINVSGLKVYSREIENILYNHPATEAAAVVGVPDPEREGSERVVAFIQPKKDYPAQVREDEYLDFLKDKISRYAMPRAVVFLPELPLTGMQKVDKKQLRQIYARKLF